jgi:hypothetical protein
MLECETGWARGFSSSVSGKDGSSAALARCREPTGQAAAARFLLGLAPFALEPGEVAETPVPPGVALERRRGVVPGALIGWRGETARGEDRAEACAREQQLDELQRALGFGGRGEEHGATVPPAA